MATPPQNQTFAFPLMFLCLGAALLILIRWGGEVASSGASVQRSIVPSTPAAKSAEKPALPVAYPAIASASKLIVDLSDRRVYLFIRDRPVTFYPIAIGQPGWETPTGKFQVIQMQQNPEWVHPITGEVVRSGPANPLGSRWIGFWTDGHEQIGFHGTAEEKLVGKAVSHGCLRMRNQDVVALYQQIKIGTPVIVRP